MTTERKLELILEAAQIFRAATLQSHNGHWDSTQQSGAGCPECIKAREARAKGDAILIKVQEAIWAEASRPVPCADKGETCVPGDNTTVCTKCGA